MGLLDYLENPQPYKGQGNQLRQQFPKLYGALGGLLGTAPDEFDGSVLDPLTAQVRKGAEMGFYPGALAQMLVGLPTKSAQIGKAAVRGMDNLAQPTPFNLGTRGQGGATVWHGSPHKFDKFDSSKIGTGEGAQAYGHGLYLAESPDVAKQYALDIKDKTNASQFFAPRTNTVQNAIDYFKAMKSGEVPRDIKGGKAVSDAYIESQISKLQDALPGLYKVDLPDEHIAKMLDWDKPLSQQAPEVQKALSGIEGNFGEIPDFNLRKWMDADPLASTWHNVLQRDMGADPAMITKTLKDRGIPGIRYLDGGSRSGGAGTSNYVVFPGNEGLLSILERNGQALK